MCRRNSRYFCKKTGKVVPFFVSHTCVIQTFLSHALKNACITVVRLNTYVVKEITVMSFNILQEITFTIFRYFTGDYIDDFQYNQRKLLKMTNDRIISGLTVQQCAKACVDEETFSCSSFAYCGNYTECRLSSSALNGIGQTSIQPNAYCDEYSSKCILIDYFIIKSDVYTNYHEKLNRFLTVKPERFFFQSVRSVFFCFFNIRRDVREYGKHNNTCLFKLLKLGRNIIHFTFEIFRIALCFTWTFSFNCTIVTFFKAKQNLKQWHSILNSIYFPPTFYRTILPRWNRIHCQSFQVHADDCCTFCDIFCDIFCG